MILIIAAVGIFVLSTLTEKAVTALIDHARAGHTAADPGKPSFNAVLERSQRTPSTRPPTKGCTHPHPENLAPFVTSGPAPDASLDLLTLEVGYGLIPLVDASQGGDLLDRVKLIRRQFALDMGFVVPPIRIRDNLSLRPNSYSIKMKGLEIAQWEVMAGHFLAMDPGTAQEPVEGLETREPTFGLPARWISAAYKERAQILGYTVVDPSSVVATHLSEVIRREARELLGRQEVQALLNHWWRASSPPISRWAPCNGFCKDC